MYICEMNYTYTLHYINTITHYDVIQYAMIRYTIVWYNMVLYLMKYE